MRKLPLFSQCSKRELAAIATLADLIDVPQGMQLVTEGAEAREFMVLVEGSADVKRQDKRIAKLGSGDFFGEIALVCGGPRTASVTTTSHVSVLVITERPFRTLLKQMPAIELKILRSLAERLRPMAI
jgi:CRP-like cAMP-binding protein